MMPVHEPARFAEFNFALIEPWNLDKHRFPRPKDTVVCIPPMVAPTYDDFPGLVRLDVLSERESTSLQELIEDGTQTQRPAVSALIKCQANQNTVASFIGNVQLFRKVEQEGYCIVRFYDPAVFALLDAVYSDRQKAHLFGPIAEWQFPWLGHWWRSTAPVVDRAHHIVEPTVSQWSILQRADCVYKALVTLANAENHMSSELCATRLALGLNALQEALNVYGLVSSDDLTEFVFYSVKHAGFGTHPKVKESLDGLRAKTQIWAEVAVVLAELELLARDSLSTSAQL